MPLGGQNCQAILILWSGQTTAKAGPGAARAWDRRHEVDVVAAGQIFYGCGEAGKINDLMTTGTDPDVGIREPTST